MADNIFACKTAYSNVIDLADNTDSYIKSGSLTTWQIFLCLINGPHGGVVWKHSTLFFPSFCS